MRRLTNTADEAQRPKGIDEIISIVAGCDFPGHKITVRRDGDRAYLQVRGWEPDTVTGDPAPEEGHAGRKWMISSFMTKTEIVRTTYLACRAYMLHEFDELFKYRERPIFNAHMDVDALWGACEHLDARGGLTGSSSSNSEVP